MTNPGGKQTSVGNADNVASASETAVRRLAFSDVPSIPGGELVEFSHSRTVFGCISPNFNCTILLQFLLHVDGPG
jgi:hypothetical protein